MEITSSNLAPLTLEEEEMIDGGGYASYLAKGVATGTVYGAIGGGVAGAVIGFNAGIIWGSSAYVVDSLISGSWK